MPELPEVRTVTTQLVKLVKNTTVTNVEVFLPKLLKNCNIEQFKNYLVNEKILSVYNIGKYIIFKLSNDKNLISHLRMTGKYFNDKIEGKIRRNHDYVIFKLNNHTDLIYNDYRQFGAFYIKNTNELFITNPLNKLGKEPWDINTKELYDSVKNKNTNVKTLLLDQNYILGIGNIYANEILFEAKINPEAKCKDINYGDWLNIIEISKDILSNAIKHGGSTINSYSSVNGIVGNYQNFLKVHMKSGKKCIKCDNIISKKLINQRMTYYCPNCQK
ncbi:DNA-formamidopyrimidine glycosylase [Mycoplasmopsis felifaucium]|uniref:DNA-formamidopyrimidine glycosylase n=1 Tax=Mycoplasmopsis felifaucium TaxID=35768 RepID=UPI000480E34A|nr:DNA-formamidopyrimidine glycosylase [Mycoplasmopsis felifaucium]